MMDAGKAKLRILAKLTKRESIILLFLTLVLIIIWLFIGADLLLGIIVEFAIFAIVTLSLNLETGHTGIPQFGRVLAVMAGAFAVGAIPGRILAWSMGLPYGFEYGDDTVNYKVVPKLTDALAANAALSIGFFILCLVLAAVSGAALGWLTSRPAIRLKEAYLGISLLAFGDFLMWIGHNWEPLVGGTTAVFIPDPFRITGAYRFHAVVLTIFIMAILIYLLIQRLTKSPFGRSLKMLRDSDLAAGVYGKDIVKVRTQSLIIGSAIAAIGGALYTIYTGTCTAIGFTKSTWTFWPWAYMMLGGIGSNLGVMVGVLAFSIVSKLIVIYRFQVLWFLIAWGINPLWLVDTLTGLVIILVVLFMPYGLIPEKPEPTLPQERINNMLESVRKRLLKKE
jgi:branched-chain amino acid transport system permease protein